MRVAASVVAVAVLAGCFPENPRARTFAKYGEGAAVVAGVIVLAVANSGADCDALGQPGVPDSNCRKSSTTATSIGLSAILVGLVGFIATISTTPDDKRPTTTVTTPPQPLPPPAPLITDPAKPPAPAPMTPPAAPAPAT
jgi:hypothetical protein